MSDKPKPDDADDDQRKTDEVLRRLLHTPPVTVYAKEEREKGQEAR